MRRHTAARSGARVSYLQIVAAPFVMFALKTIPSRLLLQWGVAIGLSFVGWLFVRKR